MRKLFFILVFSLAVTFIGCDTNRFTADMDIEPEISKIEDSSGLAVKYRIGNLLILDVWYNLNAAQIMYLLDPNEEKTIHLNIKAGDFIGVKFNYSIGSMKIQTDPMKWDDIKEYIDEIPNKVWEAGGPKKDETTKEKKDMGKL